MATLLRGLVAFLFFVFFLVMVTVVSMTIFVSDTLLEADFYKEQMLKVDMYNFLHGDAIPTLVEENLGRQQGLPLRVGGDTDMVVGSVQRVVRPDWIQENAEQVIDQVVPYLSGESDYFTVTVNLEDRVDVALEIFLEWLRSADTHEYILDQVLPLLVYDNIGHFLQLPLGVTLTANEISEDLRKVISQEWVQLRVAELFGEVGPYLVGDKEQFRVVVPLDDRVDSGVAVLIERAERKFQKVLGSVPDCGTEHLSQLGLARLSRGELPPCLATEITHQQAMGLLALNVGISVREGVGDRLPTTLIYTEVDLQHSLRKLSWDDGVEALGNVRKALNEGFTYTEADVREHIAKAEDGRDILSQLDAFRYWADPVRRNIFLLYIPIAIVIGVIGFLMGRGWLGCVRWGAATMAVGGGVIMVIGHFLRVQTRDKLDLNLEGIGLPTVVIGKVNEISANFLDTFFGFLVGQVQTYLVIGLVVLVGSVAVPMVLKLRRDEREI